MAGPFFPVLPTHAGSGRRHGFAFKQQVYSRPPSGRTPEGGGGKWLRVGFPSRIINITRQKGINGIYKRVCVPIVYEKINFDRV